MSALGLRRPRVLGCCGGMVIVSGLERMTFETLRVLGQLGAVVHCVLNSWSHARILPLVEAVGASWSEGLGYFLEDPGRARRAGAEARASLERFSRERFASAWWNLIRERT